MDKLLQAYESQMIDPYHGNFLSYVSKCMTMVEVHIFPVTYVFYCCRNLWSAQPTHMSLFSD